MAPDARPQDMLCCERCRALVRTLYLVQLCGPCKEDATRKAGEPLELAARLLGQHGGQAKGETKRRGDSAYYADLARKAAEAKRARRG